MDRFTSMAVFVRVVEEHSFAAAARHLRLSPAMVSAHVRALEEHLGARLLNRTTRSLNLTDVGRAYHERCAFLLAELEQAERVASALHMTPRGVLRINASPAFGARQLAPAIAAFTAAYPDMSVEMTVSDRFVDLVEEGYDLAIRVEPLRDSSLIVRRLAPLRMVVCGAPSYLETRPMPRHPNDLKAHNCLTLSQLSPQGEWHFRDPDGGKQMVRVSGTLRSNSAEALRAAALRGQGLICLPSYLIGKELRRGDLVPVLLDHAPAGSAINALYPHRVHLSAKVRSFVDFLVARFGQEPSWDQWRPVLAPRRTEPVTAS